MAQSGAAKIVWRSYPFLEKKLRTCAVMQVRTNYTCGSKGTEEKKVDKKVACTDMHVPIGNKKFAPVTHVVFNYDGVVLNSERILTESNIRYLARYKKRYTDKLRHETNGMREEDAAAVIIKEHLLPTTPVTYAHGVRQYMRETIHKAKLVEGIRTLICHLSFTNIPIALNSSNSALQFKLKSQALEVQEIIHRFCHITLGSDPAVKLGKPEPDHYRATVYKFLRRPTAFKHVLAIEDSYSGMMSAKAAGMQVILLPTPGMPSEMLKEADLVVHKVEDIDLEEFTLPKLARGVMY